MRTRNRVAALADALNARPCPRCRQSGPTDPPARPGSADSEWWHRLTREQLDELCEMHSRVNLISSTCPVCGRGVPPDLSAASDEDARRLIVLMDVAIGMTGVT